MGVRMPYDIGEMFHLDGVNFRVESITGSKMVARAMLNAYFQLGEVNCVCRSTAGKYTTDAICQRCWKAVEEYDKRITWAIKGRIEKARDAYHKRQKTYRDDSLDLALDNAIITLKLLKLVA